jgi:hypothetical protein
VHHTASAAASSGGSSSLSALLSSYFTAAARATASVRRTLSLFPAHLQLSVPHDVWSRALASPAFMNPTALCAGLPRLVSRAHLLASGRLVHIPRLRPPTLAQIDARLRRCMDVALQTTTLHALSPRLVIVNALHLSGRKLPTLATLFAVDQFHRHTATCDPVVAPTTSYSAEEAAAEAWWREASWPQRAAVVWADFRRNMVTIAAVLRLVVLFTPLALSAPLAFYFGVSRQAWMEKLRQTMEAAGPAFIKWGQWAATRQDMFPPDMCTELARMQAGAPTHPCVPRAPCRRAACAVQCCRTLLHCPDV